MFVSVSACEQAKLNAVKFFRRADKPNISCNARMVPGMGRS